MLSYGHALNPVADPHKVTSRMRCRKGEVGIPDLARKDKPPLQIEKRIRTADTRLHHLDVLADDNDAELRHRDLGRQGFTALLAVTNEFKRNRQILPTLVAAARRARLSIVVAGIVFLAAAGLGLFAARTEFGTRRA